MDSDKDKATSDVPANGGEEPTAPEESSENQPVGAATEDDTKPAPAPRAAKGGQVVATLALLLAIIACAGSVYMWYSKKDFSSKPAAR